MPGLVRNSIIVAAVDGLIIQPSQRSNRTPALKIAYGTYTIQPLDHHLDPDSHESPRLESFGIIGLLNVSTSAFLLAITRRQQVAHYRGGPVYVVQDVVLIPIGSRAEAERAIANWRSTPAQDADQDGAARTPTNNTEDDNVGHLDDTWLDEHIRAQSDASGNGPRRRTSIEDRESGIAQDVISRKGIYGPLTSSWFSTKGWLTGQRRNQGMSGQDDLAPTFSLKWDTKSQTDLRVGKDGIIDHASEDQESAGKQSTRRMATSLIPRLLHTTRSLLASQTFYFSYDDDITHSVQTLQQLTSDIPLHRQVDLEFFWNRHLALPFIEHGLDDFVLPVMQGFVGQRSFTVGEAARKSPSDANNAISMQRVLDAKTPGDEREQYFESDEVQISNPKEFLLTLISRRRIKRAGLRFHRRGIDEEGNTANTVETEQILCSSLWKPREEVQSFVQIRGSIPLFFSQSPYTPKPVPMLHGSFDTNHQAFTKHFMQLAKRYGKVQAVTLLDQHGGEANVGKLYEKHVQHLNQEGGINGSPLGFEWFDFHTVCRGMKFENVSRLVSDQSNYLKTTRWTRKNVLESEPSESYAQTGVVRTNCMDCLDRTNVVQAAFAQSILERQLATSSSGDYSINLTDDPNTTWFNTLWADNGDAVSRAYAGTSALKGDYTRTRRRNFRGTLTDLTLSVTRYYQNLFNDFFGQAAVDYLLGTVTEAVFDEFEARMTSVDPAIDLRKAREAAIMSSAKVIIDDDEDLLSGWAMAAPAVPNSLRATPFQEALLLLTDCALYAIRYDWDNEKPRSFERVPLDRVEGVQWGTYVTETLATAQTDTNHNAGLVVRFSSAQGKPSLVRVNTQSLENLVDVPMTEDNTAELKSRPAGPIIGKVEIDSVGREQSRLVAFKALPRQSTVVRDDPNQTNTLETEREFVRQVCNEILVAANKHRATTLKTGAATQGVESDETLMQSSDYEHDMITSGTSTVQNKLVAEERDIVSVEEAKRRTGYLDQIEYSLKRFVWG